MEIIQNKLLLFLISTAVFSASTALDLQRDEIQPRYLVFQGLDAESEEIREWYNGYASPFNILFGPKPYVLGWVSENSFDSGEDEDEENPDYDYEEGEEGENPDYEEPEYEEI